MFLLLNLQRFKERSAPLLGLASLIQAEWDLNDVLLAIGRIDYISSQVTLSITKCEITNWALLASF
jgi:hypothetical protein